jgi:hypothetical protein
MGFLKEKIKIEIIISIKLVFLFFFFTYLDHNIQVTQFFLLMNAKIIHEFRVLNARKKGISFTLKRRNYIQ